MIREIIHYDAPVLRAKGRLVGEITPEIRKLIADMFATMRHARGVGLAAQQVGEAIQVAVIRHHRSQGTPEQDVDQGGSRSIPRRTCRSC